MTRDKQASQTNLNRPCACGSTKAAAACCFNGSKWHKPPAVLGLKSLPAASAVAKCYMKDLNSCDGPISGEHLISQSVIKILNGDIGFSISGMPSQKSGEAKMLAPGSLRANCLCVKHNSALHPLDDAAKFLFGTLKSFLGTDNGNRHAIVSGHDIERWLLKTAKAVAVKKNFSRERVRLSGAFTRDEAILDMLDSPEKWPSGTGLYCLLQTDEIAELSEMLQLQPLTNDQGEIEALWLKLLGLTFVLQLAPLDVVKQ